MMYAVVGCLLIWFGAMVLAIRLGRFRGTTAAFTAIARDRIAVISGAATAIVLFAVNTADGVNPILGIPPSLIAGAFVATIVHSMIKRRAADD